MIHVDFNLLSFIQLSALVSQKSVWLTTDAPYSFSSKCFHHKDKDRSLRTWRIKARLFLK